MFTQSNQCNQSSIKHAQKRTQALPQASLSPPTTDVIAAEQEPVLEMRAERALGKLVADLGSEWRSGEAT